MPLTTKGTFQVQLDRNSKPLKDNFSLHFNNDISGKLTELNPSTKDMIAMCELISRKPKPDGKTNNWYKMHGYKMTRRVGRKYINRNMHEFNSYMLNIAKESDGKYTINGHKGCLLDFGGDEYATKQVPR